MNPLDHQRLADWLATQVRVDGLRVVGLNGAQGSGKSTLAEQLVTMLRQRHQLRAAVLSLDDLYLPKAARQRLAATVHPLLATRGVPGTHDIALGAHLLQTLPRLRAHETLRMPRFLKLADDRAAEADGPLIQGPVDLVIFEGWCVGTPPQADAELQAPINALERDDDADGRWRHWVNARLADDYVRQLFAPLQRLIVLQAPSFDVVFQWRRQQELSSNRQQTDRAAPMTDTALRRFIAHYERLTRHALATLPARADCVLHLDAARNILGSDTN